MRLPSWTSITAIDDLSDDLAIARFEGLTWQIPTLYGILGVISVLLGILMYPVAPAALVLGPALLAVVGCTLRAVWWIRKRRTPISAAFARKCLRQTHRLALLLAAALTIWSMALLQYAPPEKELVVLLLFIYGGAPALFSLVHIRFTVLVFSAIMGVGFVVCLLLTTDNSSLLIGTGYMASLTSIIMLTATYSRDFMALVESRRRIATMHLEAQALSEENNRIASIDALTGLQNRRRFFIDLAADDDETLAVGVIDLDGFKAINDTFGHQVGDQVLVEASRRLSQASAAATSIDVTIYRLGGDEFGVLIRRAPDNRTLAALGETLAAAVREPYDLRPETATVGGSIGIARRRDVGSAGDALYSSADYALYHAKRAKRGGCILFSRQHQEAIRAKGKLEQALLSADFERELSVVFQPIIDLSTGEPVHLEVLARWDSPVLGLTMPGLFIPAAERTGTISQITSTIMRKALEAARPWPQRIGLSFNLSARDICSADGAARLKAVLSEAGVEPWRIHFEITETAMATDFETARKTLWSLKAMGCRISLDDFGTGYSSLNYVQQLPFDQIKIDQAFLADVERNDLSGIIVKTIVRLCAETGIKSVAEGVETNGQLEALRRFGCDMAQGYHFAAPLQPDAVAAFIQRSSPARRRVPRVA